MRLFAVLALVLPLAACGGGGSSSGTELKVTVWPSGHDGPSTSHTITCPGDARCERLLALPANVFEPVPPGIGCIQIYSGPDVAEVHGTIEGRKVDATFKRTDGCETARWNKAAFLFTE
jgi:hypothetical protein